MLSRLGRSGWALVAAGALGITLPASAQTPAMPVIASAEKTPNCPAPATDACRLELAWLGHPTTFPHNLTATVGTGGIEIRGFVPSEAVREQAVALTQQTTSLPVHDRLSVHSGLSSRLSAGTAIEIQRDAILALRDVFGSRIDTVEVAARPGGQVTLRGRIQTLEYKLHASRQMRQVRGCTCVANQLIVDSSAVMTFTPPTPVPVATVAWTPAVPAPEVQPKPVEIAAPQVKQVKVEERAQVPVPAFTARAKPIEPVLGRSPYGAVYSPAAGVKNPSPYAMNPESISFTAPPAPTKPPPAPAPLPQSVTTAPKPTSAPKVVPAPPPATKVVPAPTPVTRPAPAPTPVTKPAPKVLPAISVTRTPAPKVVPASATVPPVAPKVIPAVATVVEPAKPADPVKPGVPGKVSEQGYESKGVLLVVDDEIAPPAILSTEVIAPAKLETIIRNLCGKDIQDVKVTPMPNRSVNVTVTLSSSEAEQRVVPLLLQLPEMSHLNVRLEVSLP